MLIDLYICLVYWYNLNRSLKANNYVFTTHNGVKINEKLLSLNPYIFHKIIQFFILTKINRTNSSWNRMGILTNINATSKWLRWSNCVKCGIDFLSNMYSIWYHVLRSVVFIAGCFIQPVYNNYILGIKLVHLYLHMRIIMLVG